jgi:hypothetical protein
MSRHILTAKDPALRVVVGWDPPLATFFLQVEDLRKEDDEDEDPMVAWLGFEPDEIPTVEALAEKLAPWAEIPMETRLRLAAERLVNNGDPRVEATLTDALLDAVRAFRSADAVLLAELQELRPQPRHAGVGGHFIMELARRAADIPRH